MTEQTNKAVFNNSKKIFNVIKEIINDTENDKSLSIAIQAISYAVAFTVFKLAPLENNEKLINLIKDLTLVNLKSMISADDASSQSNTQ